ncbi:MAG: flagellin [Paracoccaceae bacterium]
MTVGSMGDLAMAFALRQRSTEVKNDIQQFNQELTTGMAADVSDHLGGSYARLTSVERDIRILDGYRVTVAEAQQFTSVMQVRMEEVSDLAIGFSSDLIALDASNSGAAREPLASEARLHFDTIVETLNQKSAGRSVFAGDATDQSALAAPDDIFAQIELAIAGATTADDVNVAIDNWFADATGFDSLAYTGGTGAIAPFKMSDTVTIGTDIRANDPAFKDVLKALAKAAVSTSSALSLPSEDQAVLIQTAASGLIAGQSAIISTQAKLGTAEEQIEAWSLRNQTELIGMENAKAALLAVDPYETATRLEAAQFQLQSLYAVTVRLSELSLVNYLR